MLNELRCVMLKQFELLHDVVIVHRVRTKLARCIARFLELVAQRACCAATCHAPQTCWLRLCKYWAMPRAHLARTEIIDERHAMAQCSQHWAKCCLRFGSGWLAMTRHISSNVLPAMIASIVLLRAAASAAASASASTCCTGIVARPTRSREQRCVSFENLGVVGARLSPCRQQMHAQWSLHQMHPIVLAELALQELLFLRCQCSRHEALRLPRRCIACETRWRAPWDSLRDGQATIALTRSLHEFQESPGPSYSRVQGKGR